MLVCWSVLVRWRILLVFVGFRFPTTFGLSSLKTNKIPLCWSCRSVFLLLIICLIS